MKNLIEKLGIQETAGLGGILSAIFEELKNVHHTALDAINTSRGTHRPNVFEGIDRFRNKVKEHDLGHDEEDEDGNTKYIKYKGRMIKNPKYKPKPKPKSSSPPQPNSGVVPPKANKQSATPINANAINQIKKAHQKTLMGMAKKLHKLTQSVKVAHKMAKQANQNKTRSAAPSKTNRSASRKKATPQPVKYIAKRTVAVKILINGKVATTTIRKGAPYSLIKTTKGIQLKRRGQRGMVFIAPSQLSKLH